MADRSPQTVLGDFDEAWPADRPVYRRDGDVSWREYPTALRDLVVADTEAIPHLVHALRGHDNRQVRALAARSLGFIAADETVPALGAALREDDWPTTRLLAADALGMIGNQASKQALESVRPDIPEDDTDLALHVRIALQRKTGVEQRAKDELRRISADRVATARVGEAAPSFVLRDAGGGERGPSDYRDRVVALMFVYGDG